MRDEKNTDIAVAEDLKPILIVSITDHYNSNQPVINTTGNFKKNTRFNKT